MEKQDNFMTTRLEQTSGKPERLLFQGHCDINQVKMFTTSDTKMVLLTGNIYIHQTAIFTSSYH